MGGAADLNGRGLSVRARARPPEVARPRRVMAQRPARASGVGRLFVQPAAPASGRLAPSLLGWLRSREAELQEAVFARVRAVEPDAVASGDTQLEGGLRETIAACIACGLASIERGESWPEPVPPTVAEHARSAAAGGISLTTALSRCIAGFGLAWRFVLSEVACRDLPDEQKLALLLQVWAAMESLHARVQTEIADAHSCEIAHRARSQEQRRAEIVHRLLVGGTPDAGELAELGYEFDSWHLGVIATGVDADKAVRCLQAGLGCELLAVACGGKTVWAWLGGERRLAFADVERVVSAQEHTDVSLVVGEPARGLKGWRVTHQEAEGAVLVAREWPCRLTRYADVESLATALQDEALADSLIETYLLPLEDMGIGRRAARSTLCALFDAEHHVTSAAHKLDLDRSTIHRRREEIERRLGCRLQKHQADIELALRIEEWREHRAAKAQTRRAG
jgi:hypothetical protein